MSDTTWREYPGVEALAKLLPVTWMATWLALSAERPMASELVRPMGGSSAKRVPT